MTREELKAAFYGPAPRNRVGCVDCGDVIESEHRHDYKSCRCGNVSVDGGSAYFKRSFAAALPVELPTEDALARFVFQPGHTGCGTSSCCGTCDDA